MSRLPIAAPALTSSSFPVGSSFGRGTLHAPDKLDMVGRARDVDVRRAVAFAGPRDAEETRALRARLAAIELGAVAGHPALRVSVDLAWRADLAERALRVLRDRWSLPSGLMRGETARRLRALKFPGEAPIG